MAFVGSAVAVSSRGGVRSAFVCGRAGAALGAAVSARRTAGPASVRMVAAPEASTKNERKSAPKRTKTAVITGASSGIGMYATKQLVETGEWKVIMACRNKAKAESVAKQLGLESDGYEVVDLDLSSLDNVRQFVRKLRESNVTVDTLVCNAAIWHPKDKKPRYTVDGFEESVAVNYFAHFLLVNLMIRNGTLASRPQRGGHHGRVVFIGTETHNPDTLPGKIPPQADLADLEGLEAGFKSPVAMISGKKFEPTKAYKDSKVCISILMNELDRRFGRQYNITFTTLFPGCVAKSGLFREKRGWFRQLFPLFQEYVTKQYVTVEEAGRRAACVASEDRFERGAAYWRWRGTGADADVYQKPVSWEALDTEKAKRLWDLTADLVELDRKF
mmetsp:Transcript_10588/g.32407  ORF Transcript_10588/g.32407 Transcript_10588/m.32407 type:complete len:388 (+) Transcript_10588:79-1242(+)|eukprot:CAMPEP_0198723610 /NCGR_PEP_ID=MMETSP1475-20131203/1131_1 /TAXON_ID= ORGANISM="Unidentified sp., Strain CCMP1999" /NCGR_SAMPLE_ID=MMETSP1475 /ASSEMBLY_ACC=CAM_ASM_001111 /LENGTH=387 /DNA_ID=CAMNT_0044484827 /DNA_START=87 /DNA_END=1250 /DNA_ORIENTATION=+